MRMQKIQFRIGELAKQLAVEKFVIRFWEKEFNLDTSRSGGGQRFYSQDDLNQFKRIKELLYSEGFTIAGAKKQISDENSHTDTVMGSHKTSLKTEEFQLLCDKLLLFKKQLMSLRDIL